jgi:hypothetical protein
MSTNPTPPTPENPLLHAALSYAKRGWRVFPCHTPTTSGCSCGKDCGKNVGKHPRTEHGLRDATTAEAQIRAWWQRWPRANVAVRTGEGFVVIDLDPRHDAAVGIELLEADGCTFPDTVESITGGDGRHLFYQYAGDEVHNSVGSEGHGLAQGVDVRGTGGYVILPPSLHASRKRYVWEMSSHPDEIEMVPLPESILTRLRTARPSANGQPADSGTIPEGQRNATLTSLAGTMRRRGMSADSILAALHAENRRRCVPPLPEAEVIKIAQSVGRYAPPKSSQTSETEVPKGPKGSSDPGSGTFGTAESEDSVTFGRPLPLPDPLAPVAVFDYALLPKALRG